MNKGKFIVIEGTDGSGKATQARLLIKRLSKVKFDVVEESFPQYGKRSAALVEDYLKGKFGTARELGPYIPSVFYAADRFAAKKRMQGNLNAGKMIVADRYVASSMAHQGSKIDNNEGRREFYDWLFELEFKIFGIPKPDLTLILHVPSDIAQRLVDTKDESKREYTTPDKEMFASVTGLPNTSIIYSGEEGMQINSKDINQLKKTKKRDEHERDINHLQLAEESYLKIAEGFDYEVIECVKEGKLLSREEISELVWKKVEPVLQ